MIARRSARAAALVFAACLAACAPALRQPRPLVVPAAVSPPAQARDVDALLARAAALFERRPDAAAIDEAERRFVEAATADASRTEGLCGAVQVLAWRIERTPDAATRGALLQRELDDAQWCVRRAEALPAAGRAEPAGACAYFLAITLGQQAREHPATAGEALARMLAALRQSATAVPAFDHAGPDRVLALLRLRAPGWPIGPGDVEEGLAAARRAVERDRDFPPNALALAEALRKNGMRDAARAEAERALTLALASHDPDAPSWAAEARATPAP